MIDNLCTISRRSRAFSQRPRRRGVERRRRRRRNVVIAFHPRHPVDGGGLYSIFRNGSHSLLRFYCDKVDVNSPCQAKVSILLQALLSYVIKVSRIFEHFPRTVLLSRAATGPDALAVRSVHSLLLLRGVDAQLTPSSSTRKFP